jgi:hypothetical protein
MLNAKVRFHEVEQAINEVMSLAGAGAQAAEGNEESITQRVLTGKGSDLPVELTQIISLVERFGKEEPVLGTAIAKLGMQLAEEGKALSPSMVAIMIFRAAEIAWVREHKDDPVNIDEIQPVKMLNVSLLSTDKPKPVEVLGELEVGGLKFFVHHPVAVESNKEVAEVMVLSEYHSGCQVSPPAPTMFGVEGMIKVCEESLKQTEHTGGFAELKENVAKMPVINP